MKTLIAIAILLFSFRAHAMSCMPQTISETEARAYYALSDRTPFTPMYYSSGLGYLYSANWMLTSESKVGEQHRKDLFAQQGLVTAFTGLWAAFQSMPAFCGFKTEQPIDKSAITSSDLRPEDVAASQRRFLIFHSLNMVSLGVISFQSEHPQKGEALAFAFAIPILTDVINRSLFSKNAYSPWTLSGGISHEREPMMLVNYAF